MVKIVFVCLGNICRSPTAEGVLLKLVEKEGLSDKVYIESAGTSYHHEGDLPDPRTREAALKRGYVLDTRAQQFKPDFFSKFDWIITMDQSNYNNVVGQAPLPSDKEKVIPFSHLCIENSITHVPDPYYEGEDGFEVVLDLIEDGCRGLIDRIKDQLATGN